MPQNMETFHAYFKLNAFFILNIWIFKYIFLWTMSFRILTEIVYIPSERHRIVLAL